MTTSNRFEVKDPWELQILTFDFSAGLATGEALVGTPTVSVTTVYGTDSNPSAILAGGNTLDATSTKYLVPVKAGIDGCDYDIVVDALTTTASKTLSLGGILPVRAQ